MRGGYCCLSVFSGKVNGLEKQERTELKGVGLVRRWNVSC